MNDNTAPDGIEVKPGQAWQDMRKTNAKLISTLAEELKSAMYFCAGAALDPDVPKHTREALRSRESRISDLLKRVADELP